MFTLPPQVNTALAILENNGFKGYVVGGCLRDILMGKRPHDWDGATDAQPHEMEDVFSDYKVLETGVKHGTLTVIIEDMAIEITTFRIDGEYHDGRRPSHVTFTKNIEDDLARRDFTINAIAYSATKGIVDPFSGREDIENKIIRCVGDGEKRFSEDPLRILRGLRFAAVLGFEIEDKTLKAMEKYKDLLSDIAGERIKSELTLMLCGKYVGEVLQKYSTIIIGAIPEISPMIGFDQCNRHHCYDVWEHTVKVVENAPAAPVDRWAAFFHDFGKPATFTVDEGGEGHFYGHQAISYQIANTVMKRIRFDNHSREAVLLLVKYHDVYIKDDKKAIKRYLNRFGKTFLYRLLALKSADNLGQAPEYRGRQAYIVRLQHLLNEVIEEKECFSIKDLAIDGNDIMEHGYKGPQVGRVLRVLLEAVIDEQAENTKPALLEYMKRM